MEIAIVINNIAHIITESSTSSESDSDSDGMEEILTILTKDRTNYIPRMRCKRYVEDIVPRYTNREFKSHFRLHRNTFYFILELIGSILERNGKSGRSAISSEKQLLLALWIIATPNSYRCVSVRSFRCWQSNSVRSVRRVINALYSFLDTFIKWPTREEAAKTYNVIQNLCGIPKVIGAVDGTHIHIAAPNIYPEAYINRKGYHSMQLQVICDSNLKFIHCYTGHWDPYDARVFKLSGMYNYFTDNYFYENSHILGDAAYIIDPCVMVPFKDNGHLTESQIRYNTCHSKGRIMVERALGLLKSRFRSILDRLPMTRTDLIPKYVIACCILHNICILQKDFIEIPIIVNEPQHISYNDINNVQRNNQGVEKRNMIVYQLIHGNI